MLNFQAKRMSPPQRENGERRSWRYLTFWKEEKKFSVTEYRKSRDED